MLLAATVAVRAAAHTTTAGGTLPGIDVTVGSRRRPLQLPSQSGPAPIVPRFDGNKASLPDPFQTWESPSKCSGWLESRAYLEGQAWYTRPGQDIDKESSRLLVGACMPHRQWIAGVLPLHILVQKYKLPKGATKTAPIDIQVQFESLWPKPAGRKTNIKYTVKNFSLRSSSAWTCSSDGALCKAVLSLAISTNAGSRTYVPDGLNRMTIFAIYPKLDDGVATRSFQARIGSYVLVNNRGNAQWPPPRAYEVPQYSITPFPWGNTHAEMTTDFPVTKINNTFVFSTKHYILYQAKAFASVSRAFVTLDPVYLNPSAENFTGTVLLDALAAERPADCPAVRGHVDCSFSGVELDTTLVPDGKHKLMVRTDSYVDPKSPLLANVRSNGGTFSSASLLTLDVCNNPGEGSTCSEDQPGQGPPDEHQPTPPALPKPPGGVVFYNGSQPIPLPAQVAETPYDCSGWLEPRVYLEAQTWYTRPSDDVTAQSAQLLVGACMPHKQMVAGTFPVHILVQKNRLPSFANISVTMRVRFVWKENDITFELMQTGSQKKWSCGNLGPVCRAVYVAKVNTVPQDGAWLIPDGPTQIQLWASARIEDGVANRTVTARSNSWLVVANYGASDISGRALPPSSTTRTVFPWYDTHAGLLNALPEAPVTGPWGLGVKHWLGAKTGANVTGLYVALDPDFQAQTPYPGHPLLSIASNPSGDPINPFMIEAPPSKCIATPGDGGALKCYFIMNPASVPTDCARNPCVGGLCDGPHRLVVRTDSLVAKDDTSLLGLPPGGPLNGGVVSSALVVPFRTANGITVRSPNCPEPRGGAESYGAAEALLRAADAGDFDVVEAEAVPVVASRLAATSGDAAAAAIGGGGGVADARAEWQAAFEETFD